MKDNPSFARAAAILIAVFLPHSAGAQTTQPGRATAEFALYLLSEPKVDVPTQLATLLAGDFADFTVADQETPPDGTGLVRPRRVAIEKYAPPSTQSLRYFGHGLNAEQSDRLQHASSVWVLDFNVPLSAVAHHIRLANDLIHRLASQNDALIWDELTREVFSLDEWKSRRIDSWDGDVPNVAMQTTSHLYRPRGSQLPRLITLGMEKFGRPDVVVNDVPNESSRSMSALVLVVCQLMVEDASNVPPKGTGMISIDIASIRYRAFRERQRQSFLKDATGKAEIAIREGQRETGDPYNRLIELTFTNFPGHSPQELQQAALSQVFGSEDHLFRTKHDRELLDARDRARAQLPMIAERFRKGPPPGEHLLVKAPFKTPDGGNEWMWVEVTQWDGNRITGILENDPVDVRDLKSGATVTVDQRELFDYVCRHADGTMEGGETSKILERREAGGG
jgi:uncharacterized protein YegJ (DUF2314 family)